MIGHIQGEVLFSDGVEVIILTNSGIGYQVHCHKIFAEGSIASIYISHVIREASEELYGFETLKSKKLFELLLTVRGVGPKSAYTLISSLSTNQITDAILFENKTALSKAPGIGPKAAAQIILDLSGRINKIKMYSDSYKISKISHSPINQDVAMQVGQKDSDLPQAEIVDLNRMMNDAIMACKELGFGEDRIIPLAQKILGEHSVNRAEQLVHLVLKEI